LASDRGSLEAGADCLTTGSDTDGFSSVFDSLLVEDCIPKKDVTASQPDLSLEGSLAEDLWVSADGLASCGGAVSFDLVLPPSVDFFDWGERDGVPRRFAKLFQ
jgi:hypothetical protein